MTDTLQALNQYFLSVQTIGGAVSIATILAILSLGGYGIYQSISSRKDIKQLNQENKKMLNVINKLIDHFEKEDTLNTSKFKEILRDEHFE